MTIDGYPHLDRDELGIPYIAGTRMKVQHIAESHTVGRLRPDQIQRQYPQVGLARIHCALAYYFDHQSEIDRLIEEGRRQVESLRASLEDPDIVAGFRATKRAIAEADEQ